ncbi:hypothetical protein TrRE_jg3238, partial [Triparma retinervis]
MEDVKRRRREVIERNSLEFGESSVHIEEQNDHQQEDDEDDEEDYDIYHPTSTSTPSTTFPFPPSFASASWRHTTLHDPTSFLPSVLLHLRSLLVLSGLTKNQLNYTWKRLRNSSESEARFRTMSELLGPRPYGLSPP